MWIDVVHLPSFPREKIIHLEETLKGYAVVSLQIVAKESEVVSAICAMIQHRIISSFYMP